MLTFSLVVVKINRDKTNKYETESFLQYYYYYYYLLCWFMWLVWCIWTIYLWSWANFRIVLILNWKKRKKKAMTHGKCHLWQPNHFTIFILELPTRVVCTGHICQYLCGGHVISSSGRDWCPPDFALLGQQRSSKHSILWWNQECGRKCSSCLLSSSPTVGRRQVRNVHI